jgi:hypothetical protein
MNRIAFIIVASFWMASIVPEVAAGYPYACDEVVCGCEGPSACDSCLMSSCKASVWGASVDALFLSRSDPSSRVLVFNTDNPAENLNAEDFQFDTEAGFDLSLTRAVGKRSALELRYFGVDGWSSRVTAATTRGDLLQFNAAVPVFAESGDAMTAVYTSKLQNAEVNFRHLYSDFVEVLAGFRYVELKEQGSGALVNADVPFNYIAATGNRLYGAQVGADALLWNSDLFRLDITGKAGIFGNGAVHNALVSTGAAALPAGGSKDQTSFVGEFGVTGATYLTENVALRGGYRLLWIDSVALASDQLAVTDFFTGRGIDPSGDVLYQGAFAGLELTF